MGKFDDVKAAQGYRETADTCSNCRNYSSFFVEKKYGVDFWTEETRKRCKLGGFAIKKTATCDKHERIEEGGLE